MDLFGTVPKTIENFKSLEEQKRSHKRQAFLWVGWKRGALSRYTRMLDVTMGVITGGVFTQLFDNYKGITKLWICAGVILVGTAFTLMSTQVDREWSEEEKKVAEESSPFP